jgi:hypothetical protein
MLKRKSGLVGGQPIKKVGRRTLEWKVVREQVVAESCDEDGLIKCQDWMIDLPRCGVAREPSEMDLHHKFGRDGDLLTDKGHLVFLTRECHEASHKR